MVFEIDMHVNIQPFTEDPLASLNGRESDPYSAVTGIVPGDGRNVK